MLIFVKIIYNNMKIIIKAHLGGLSNLICICKVNKDLRFFSTSYTRNIFTINQST